MPASAASVHRVPDLFRSRRSELRRGAPASIFMPARVMNLSKPPRVVTKIERAGTVAKVSQAVRYGARREVGLACIERE